MQYPYRQFTLLLKSHCAFLIPLIKTARKSWIIAPQEYIICSRLSESGSFTLTPLTDAYTYTPFCKRLHKHILLKQNRIHCETWTRESGAVRPLWVLGPRVWYRRSVTQEYIAAWTWASVFTQEVQVWVRTKISANWASDKHLQSCSIANRFPPLFCLKGWEYFCIYWALFRGHFNSKTDVFLFHLLAPLVLLKCIKCA